MDKLGIEGEEFTIELNNNHLSIGVILTNDMRQRFEILTNPTRKWWKTALYYLTLGLYDSPWEYKVRLTQTK